MLYKESFAAIDAAALRHLTETLPMVRYLVIGANDGLHGDPLFAHSGAANWRGTLFEPVPASFAKLLATYAGRAGASLRRQAVVASGPSGRRVFNSVPDVSVLASFRREVIERHVVMDGQTRVDVRIVPIEVDCVALDEFVAEPGFEVPDVLLTDTEGYDFALFEGWWPLGWRPAYLRIEVIHLSEVERARIGAALTEADYELFADESDVCGLRRDAYAAEDLRVWSNLRDASVLGKRMLTQLSSGDGSPR